MVHTIDRIAEATITITQAAPPDHPETATITPVVLPDHPEEGAIHHLQVEVVVVEDTVAGAVAEDLAEVHQAGAVAEDFRVVVAVVVEVHRAEAEAADSI